MKRVLILIAFVFVSPLAFSGEYCWNDKVKQLVLKGESVYFTTEKSCHGWCKLDPNWSEERKNQAYSMLLAAKVSDLKVTFFWPAHDKGSPCQNVVETYSSPTVVMLN